LEKFNLSPLNNLVNYSSACEYIYKTIQLFEIDYKLLELEKEQPCILLDIKDVAKIFGFSDYTARNIFNDNDLHIIAKSSKFQITVAELRVFLHRDLTPKSKYWKHLKGLESNDLSQEQAIMLFNSFLTVVSNYDQLTDQLVKENSDLSNSLMDRNQISQEFKWSKRLAGTTLADARLDTIAISNKVQVDRKTLMAFIQKHYTEKSIK
jgi:hypothetical protein